MQMIAQSIAFIYADGSKPHQETDPLLPVTHPVYGETVQGVMSLERQVMEAPLDGIVLRYGLLYGRGTGFAAPHPLEMEFPAGLSPATWSLGHSRSVL